MDVRTKKEKVLTQIRHALVTKIESPYGNIDNSKEIFHIEEESKELLFAQNFIKNEGKFIYCENIDELMENLAVLIYKKKLGSLSCDDNALKNLLDKYGLPHSTSNKKEQKAILTRCECLIAQYGTVGVSNTDSYRKSNAYFENHLIVSESSQIVCKLSDAMELLGKRYKEGFPSLLSFITGPSKTADIEKTLVMGAHGTKNLFLFLLPPKTLPIDEPLKDEKND
ncbi:MAG: lactate utilization protein C [Hyphomicrobiales bacterium]